MMKAIGRHGLLLALIGSAALAAGGAAARAESEPGKDKSGKWLEQLTQELTLTEAQQAQVKAVGEEFRPRKEQLKGQMTQLHEQMMQLHEQMKTLQDEKHAKIRAALTPEQQTKFDAWRQDTMGHMKGKMGRKHGMCPMCGAGHDNGQDGGTPAAP
jgi:Spy/CpxP family protein refolding chaperone